MKLKLRLDTVQDKCAAQLWMETYAAVRGSMVVQHGTACQDTSDRDDSRAAHMADQAVAYLRDRLQ